MFSNIGSNNNYIQLDEIKLFSSIPDWLVCSLLLLLLLYDDVANTLSLPQLCLLAAAADRVN